MSALRSLIRFDGRKYDEAKGDGKRESSTATRELFRLRDRFISSLESNLSVQSYKENEKGSSVIEHMVLVFNHSRSFMRCRIPF